MELINLKIEYYEKFKINNNHPHCHKLKGYAQEPIKPNFFELKELWENRLSTIDSLPDDNGYYDYEKEDGQRAKFNRWYHLWRYRVGPDGDMTTASQEMNSYVKEQFSQIQMRDGCDSPLDDNILWENLGPKNSKGNRNQSNDCGAKIPDVQNQGRIESISVSKDNSKHILAGAQNGGIWSTTDGGVEWHNVTDDEGFSNYGVTSFVRHPMDQSTIYASTAVGGGRWESKRSVYGMGVIRSIDDGETWEKTGLVYDNYAQNGHSWWSTQLGTIAIDPNSTINETKLYVVSDTKVFKYSGHKDANDNWEVFYENPLWSNGPLWWGYVENNDVIVSELDGTVWFTNNLGLFKYDGTNLHKVPSYPDNGPNPDGYYIPHPYYENIPPGCDINQHHKESINIEINNQGHILMIIVFTRLESNCDRSDGESYIYRSTDNGMTWSDPIQLFNVFFDGSGRYPHFAVSKTNSNIIYVEGNGFGSRRCATRYNFLGGNWVEDPMNVDENHVDVRTIVTTISDDEDLNAMDTVYLGTDGGISKCIDGNEWNDITGDGMSLTQYYGLGITESNENMIFCGAQDGSINYYIEGDWWETEPGGDNGDCLINPYDNNYIIQEKQNNLCRGVLSNNDVSSTCKGVGGWMNPLCWNHSVEEEFFIGVKRLYVGSTTNTNLVLVNGQDDLIDKRISSVAVSRSNPNVVYFSTDQHSNSDGVGGLFKAIKGPNDSWDDINVVLSAITPEVIPATIPASLISAPITDITVDPNDANRVWISLARFITGDKVYYSADGGGTWENITNSGLPNLPCTAISFQEGSDHLVYVGTDAGVYFHNAIDDCWSKYGIKGPPCMINDMEINQCAGKLVVATHGRGLWQVPLVEFNKPIRCCVVGEDIHIWADKTYDEDKWIPGNIIVHPGAKVTVTSTLRFNKDKSFVFMRGSKLHLDGGTLTKCEFVDDWQGVKVEGNSSKEQPDYTGMPAADEAGIIYLTNGATIEWARTAISTNYFGQWTDQKWGGLVHCEDSYFLNNYRCVEFMKYKKKNKSKFENCVFDGNSTIEGITKGVTIWETDNIKFEQCTLKNMEAHAIFAWDSRFVVTNHNLIENNEYGIFSYATYPNLTASIIGANTSGTVPASDYDNKFIGNKIHIKSNAASRLDAMKIKYNEFIGSDAVGIYFDGPSSFEIDYNDIQAGIDGMIIRNTGTLLGLNMYANNYIRYNRIMNFDKGIVTKGRNRDMQFLCNEFGTHTGDFYLEGLFFSLGEIKHKQGDEDFGANNCFTPPSNDDDITTNATVSFNYYLKGLNPCLLPTIGPNDNYNIVSSVNAGCLGGVDESFCIGIPSDIDLSDIQTQIDNYLNNGGLPTDSDYLDLIAIKECILKKLIPNYLDSNDVDGALYLLNNDNTVYAKMIKYGIQIDAGRYGDATVTLNDFSDTIPEMIDFKQIQLINLDRMINPNNYQLSISDSLYLESIALSSFGVRAYARSLFMLLTGIDIDNEDGPQQMPNPILASPSDRRNKAYLKNIKIYPNPVNDVLNIDINESVDVQYIYMTNILGTRVVNYRCKKNELKISISTVGFANGVYAISILNSKKEVISLGNIVVHR